MPALGATLPLPQMRAYSYWNSTSNRSPGTWGQLPSNNAYRDTPVSRGLKRREDRANENRPGPRVKTKLARLPRDDEIRQAYVYITEDQIDGEEGEVQLSELMELKSVLSGLDRKTQSLQVITEPEAGNPSGTRWPICRIVNKKEEHQKQQFEKQVQKKQRASAKQKEIELNWAVAPHDLDHKLKQMQRFLAKGYKVQVLLLKKANAKGKTQEKDAEAIIDRIIEATTEVQGSKEWKKREGTLLETMKIFLQGSLQEKSKGDA